MLVLLLSKTNFCITKPKQRSTFQKLYRSKIERLSLKCMCLHILHNTRVTKNKHKKPSQSSLCPKKEVTNDLLTMGSHLFAHFRWYLLPLYLAISAQVAALSRHSDSSQVLKQQELAQGSVKPASVLRERLG